MTTDRDELKAELAKSSRDELEQHLYWMHVLDEGRERLLATIPQCPEHGPCVPHAVEWVQNIIKERDELRAQTQQRLERIMKLQALVMRFYNAAMDMKPFFEALQHHYSTEDEEQYITPLYDACNQDAQDAAQYVRGLEAALQFYAEGFDDGEYQPDYVNPGMKWVTKAEQDRGERAKQALAAKEQQ